MPRQRSILNFIGLLCLLPSGCAPRSEPSDVGGLSSSRPAETKFLHPATGLVLARPPSWTVHPAADLVLCVAPPGVAPESAAISVDVPELPPHIPGLIPIGLVKNGYVDDLKKAHPDAAIDDAQEHSIAGARARLVRSQWNHSGQVRHEDAMLIVKGDHVVIVRANSDAVNYAATSAVFLEVVRSIQWTR